MRKFFVVFTLCAMLLTILPACQGGNTLETPINTMFGPADSELPYEAVFAIDGSADIRLITAAKNFCDRTLELSKGGTVFSIVLSKDALLDLRSGNADAILFKGVPMPEFAPVYEAFRYKSYEHFSMTVNSAATLSRLSDILGANVFAGFYTGANVFLSCGTLDSKFKPQRRNADDATEPSRSSVTTLADSTAQAFSLLGANVTNEKPLGTRTSAFARTDSIVEFSASELDSPILLQAIRDKNFEASLETSAKLPDSEDESDGDESDEVAETSVSSDTEPLVITRAFTGIEPAWLIFAPSVYENLSQTGRAAVSEAAAYMASDIDGVYLEYERKKIDVLLAGDITISREFTSTRTQALRLADAHAKELNSGAQKLRETIAKTQ